jgi:hypothetical protein
MKMKFMTIYKTRAQNNKGRMRSWGSKSQLTTINLEKEHNQEDDHCD